MKRRRLRTRIEPGGQLEIIDPGLDCLPLLEAVAPGFEVASAPLDGFITPRLRRTRETPVGLDREELAAASDAALWELHARALREPAPRGASLLELKLELARRVLAACSLCARRCGANRLAGERGLCQLGPEALVAEHFVHIAEEPPINPALVISLAGCGLRCQYCQQGEIAWEAKRCDEPLTAALWREMDLTDARSLEFAGGNPDESLYAILRFLSSAPARWRLPIVWNCHAYATKDTVALLDGIVDVWLPDLKYGNDTCAIRWSGAPGYAGAAFSSIAGMANQGAPVIVRILVLPGHVACCHGPALRSLAGLKGGNVTVSVRAQYAPDWRIERGQDPMGRRVRREEVAAVEQTCRDLGLRMIDSQLSSMRPKPM